MKQTVYQSFQQLEFKKKLLLDEVSGLPIERLCQKASDGDWSTIQIINHLILSEQGTVAYMQKKLLQKDQLQKAGWKSKWRILVLKIALVLPIKYKAPKVLPDPSNDSGIEDCCQRWDSVRIQLNELLNNLPEPVFKMELFKHPVAGRMNINQAISFMTAHLARHHQQIRRILSDG